LQSIFKQLITVLADLNPLADCLAESFKNFLEANRVRTEECESRSRSGKIEPE